MNSEEQKLYLLRVAIVLQLAICDISIVGKIKCSQGGHKLTNDLLRKVFEDKSNYSIIQIDEKSLPHSLIHKQKLKSIA